MKYINDFKAYFSSTTGIKVDSLDDVSKQFTLWRNWAVTNIGGEAQGLYNEVKAVLETQRGKRVANFYDVAAGLIGGTVVTLWAFTPLVNFIRRGRALRSLGAEARSGSRGTPNQLNRLDEIKKQAKGSCCTPCSPTNLLGLFALGVAAISAPYPVATAGAALLGVRTLGVFMGCIGACFQASKATRIYNELLAGRDRKSIELKNQEYWKISNDSVQDASGAVFHISAVDPNEIVG